MFGVLFSRPHAIARHRNGPLAEQRRRYLADCAERGLRTPTLQIVADYLLVITKYLRLHKRCEESISLAEVQAAAARWANRRPRPAKMQTRFNAQRRFVRHAWLKPILPVGSWRLNSSGPLGTMVCCWLNSTVIPFPVRCQQDFLWR